jgi:phosphoribosylformylglycinamidine (FGAM) synthase-like enzyme
VADTVENAAQTPETTQPWAALGLKEDEYARIREILGRRPTSSELAMYSVMWSEHCSYKSSKVHLRHFGSLSTDTPIGKLLAGIGDNAGVIDVGQGYAVTFKIESHNHPSYDRRRRDRARHPGHGGAPDRGDGLAPLRTAGRS